MFQTTIVTILTASALTFGATGAFESARSTALQMSNIYAIAGEISQGNFEADSRLFAAGDQLKPMADHVRNMGEVQLASLGY